MLEFGGESEEGGERWVWRGGLCDVRCHGLGLMPVEGRGDG